MPQDKATTHTFNDTIMKVFNNSKGFQCLDIEPSAITLDGISLPCNDPNKQQNLT